MPDIHTIVCKTILGLGPPWKIKLQNPNQACMASINEGIEEERVLEVKGI